MNIAQRVCSSVLFWHWYVSSISTVQVWILFQCWYFSSNNPFQVSKCVNFKILNLSILSKYQYFSGINIFQVSVFFKYQHVSNISTFPLSVGETVVFWNTELFFEPRSFVRYFFTFFLDGFESRVISLSNDTQHLVFTLQPTRRRIFQNFHKSVPKYNNAMYLETCLKYHPLYLEMLHFLNFNTFFR